ncbi:hypothetical protein [Flavobacterium sp.]|uniref:hypothetical protein n=1 Tax=Flavobacterium sp. TaxID=239 RepID=UPI0025BE43C4|nr:hypothetical protein [Flavobacterium sp.]
MDDFSKAITEKQLALIREQMRLGVASMYIWTDPETRQTRYVTGYYHEITKHFDDLSFYWLALGAKYRGVSYQKDVTLAPSLHVPELCFFKFVLSPEHLFDGLTVEADPVATFFDYSLDVSSELLVVCVHFTDEHNWPGSFRN